MTEAKPYRPHNPGHDYYDKGAYLVTLVVGQRDRCLSALNDSESKPGVELTELGEFLSNQWIKTVELQAKRGNIIQLHHQCVMPDHWHGVIEVHNRMSWSLGDIIQAVKAACTSFWRKTTGYHESPISAQRVRHMSHDDRRRYYASLPRHQRPLFDDDYDDTICLNEEHLRRMVAYVHDNPRRAILRRLHPQFMQRRLHITIAGRDYAAFGNLFLLNWVKKEQVFCHRMARLSQLTDEERQRYGYLTRMLPEAEEQYKTRVPYSDTQAFRQQGNAHYLSVMAGATVLVTPGISEGEKRIKNMALERHLPLIHIQKEPIGPYWKPEHQRFEACVSGRLLILAPWNPATLGDVDGIPSSTTYSQFHNLNRLAEEICLLSGIYPTVLR